MATYVRPSTRYTTADWFTANYTLSTNAERGRNAAHDVRQEAAFLRNETDSRTKWDQLDNNTRLSERVNKIRDMKALLEQILSTLDGEIASLNEAMDEMEKCLLMWNLRNHINVENLTGREGRQDIDVVADEVEDQLKREQSMLVAVKLQLQSKIDAGFEHLLLLQEIRADVVQNLQDKNITLDIDTEQYNLTIDSAGVTYKPDPLRVHKGTLTAKQWEDFCLYQKQRARTEIANSVRLRECILANIQQTNNDLESQDAASQYALRKRCHELDMALDELQWQKVKTQEEISEIEAEIDRLNAEIVVHKKVVLKLAETRLENRTYRPNEELVRDNVQYGLTDEVKQLEATLAALRDKLRQAQHALDCLEANMHRINCDIAFKKHSLNLDTQCIESRVKLSPTYPLKITERNQTLVGGARSKVDTLAF